MLRNTKRFLEMHGFDILSLLSNFTKIPKFIKDYRAYKNYNDTDFPLKLSQSMPVLKDYKDSAGIIEGHYVHQDLWAATKIFNAKPERHVDIGSRIDGFITSLLSHRTVEVVDIRPLTSPYKNLIFVQDNATKMNNFQDEELESISCLHAMEHFGLGRYGDPIEPNSYKVFAQSLTRVIKKEGMLYISVPIGKQRIEFNAHRIFNPETIINIFPNFELISFSAINDDGVFVRDASYRNYTEAQFSCGLFEFKKINNTDDRKYKKTYTP